MGRGTVPMRKLIIEVPFLQALFLAEAEFEQVSITCSVLLFAFVASS